MDEEFVNYPLASSTWNGQEELAINSLVYEGKTTMGENVKKFEKDFAKFFGAKYAVMVNSGSSANLLAIASLFYKKNSKIKRGMEVIVPAVSWSTTYYPLAQYGLKLKFVDVDLDTLCMKADEVEAAVNENTAAIFAVNLLGQPADLPTLKSIADKHDIYLIEDNCESMGASVDGKYAGTWGQIGTFSTFFSHHICTMEGGMVLTDDEEIADICMSLRAHGWTRELDAENTVFNKTGSSWDDRFRFVLPGYNLRPLEIAGAVGSIQIAKFPEFLKTRQSNHKKFLEYFSEIENVRLQSGLGKSSSFGFSLILERELVGQRKRIISQLETLGIQTRPIVAGNFLKQPVLKHMKVSKLGIFQNANAIDENGFFIGNHHFDVGDNLKTVSKILKRVIG